MMNLRKRSRDQSSTIAYRNNGDAARARGDWVGAESYYELYLQKNPDDFDIWIQYGHALKEQSKLEEAEKAYRRGLALRAGDQDACTHLGHLLKRLGRRSEAKAIFSDLLRQTGSREAYHELSGLADGGEAIPRAEGLFGGMAADHAVFLELDDLLAYLDMHATLSGIQRVQVGVIRHVLSRGDAAPTEKHVFVLNPVDDDCLWCLREEDIVAIIDYLESIHVDHARVKQLIAIARRNAVAAIPRSGQILFVLGAFWNFGSVGSRYLYLKKLGVALGLYVYDLIPITHYEYCDDGIPHEFSLSVGDALTVFDFFLTISEFTARELRSYCERLKLPIKPIKAVPLAHASSDTALVKKAAWGGAIAFLRDRPFVLMVSTIEARKNHGFLVSAWKAFIDEGLEPPDLVFVGRVGWRVSSLMELLKTTRYFDGRIHIVHDLSDAELNTLYDACLYTAFPSFVEGWGLPVGESLAHGKPCVASSTSSIPEVGGDLVDYLDPFNLRAGLEVLRKMTFDASYRERRRAAIQKQFTPRRWVDVGRDLLQSIDELSPGVEIDIHPGTYFPSGILFKPGDLALGKRLPRDYPLMPTRLMLADNWYTIEEIGCWMRGSEASISFKSDLPAGTEIIVYLRLYGAPWSSENEVETRIVSEGPVDQPSLSRSIVRVRQGGHFNIRSSGKVDKNGLVKVTLRVTGNISHESAESTSRRFALGLSSIGYASRSDLMSRVELMDIILENMIN